MSDLIPPHLDFIVVEILNWETYNPRKDIKLTQWFRMSNRIFEDPEFLSFTHSEFIVWFYILCECSKNYSGQVRIFYGHASRIVGLERSVILSAIKKLKDINVVTVHVTATLRPRDGHVTSTYADVTLQDNTKQNKTEQNNTRQNKTGKNKTKKTKKSRNPKTSDEALASIAGEEKFTQIELVKKIKAESKTTIVWEAYKGAYSVRYGEPPTFNARTFGQLAHFVSRLPEEEAPQVARFYVSHNDSFYVKAMHPVGLLLRDAEKLRTEWKTGIRMTAAQARSAETADHFQSQMARIKRGEL